ncbi:Alpha/Beta hydrolase protein [Ilyonectria sp. MPI-CAGE-AT-0026]|nr:Alpha/Beta hydrolase protein [Ilyonectria sp. MPI-CAGE-AT-0026]
MLLPIAFSLLLFPIRSYGQDNQKVLESADYSSFASASGENWSVREQDDSLCEAGSRHFAGSVNVTDDKNLFFWFFESRKDPNNRPVIIWLNGGPGASSLVGLYGEVGPCTIDKDGTRTNYNVDSWTEHANILFIDQPAGVGFSTVSDNTSYPYNLESSAPDFLALLETFYSDIFPQYAINSLYIAGESFGGQFAPHYAATILRKQKENAAGALQSVKLGGIMLVNALVDSTWMSLGHYDLFCTDTPPNLVRFNETTCRAMAGAVPECQRQGSLCTNTRDPHICESAVEFCMENLDTYFYEEVAAHRRSPYDLRRDCPEPPLCGVSGNKFGSTTDFLNREDVQRKLGFKSTIEYQTINFDLNAQWTLDPQIFVPTTSHITFLLDGGVDFPKDEINPDAVVSVLVINGEYDVGCNLPGTLREYDNLPWHRQAAYRSVNDLKPWYWVDDQERSVVGGLWKGTPQHQKGLEFLSVKDAGHMSPADQRGAVTSIIKSWVNGVQLLISL